MEDLTTKKCLDRLLVFVSGLRVNRLRGVPKLAYGIGEAQAVVNALEEWGISEEVAALSFDSTITNTGRQNGTCVLLKKKIGITYCIWLETIILWSFF